VYEIGILGVLFPTARGIVSVRLFFSDGMKPEEDLNCKRSDRPSSPIEG